MKAIRVQQYGGPEQLKFEDVPKPTPAAEQILVRVVASSVNPFDYKLASGAFKDMIPMTLPYTPGGDFSGVVDSVGSDVTSFKSGDAVFGNTPHGAWAQYLAVSAKTVAPKLMAVPHAKAASIAVVAQTAWQALFDHGQLQKGQSVLIHGAAGGVGSFAVQLAKWKGAKIFATAEPENADYVGSLGANEIINYKTTKFDDVVKDVDLVLDIIGGETQSRSYTVLKRGGRLITTVQPPNPEEAAKFGVHAEFMGMQPNPEILVQLAELLDKGTIRTLITKTFPLAKAAEALKLLKTTHTRGKLVLEMPS